MPFPQLNEDSLHLTATKEGLTLTLHWKGRSVSRKPSDFLEPYFQELVLCACLSEWEVVMDFCELEHFNSSTISALIQCIQDFKAENIALKMIYNPSLRWQRISFDALHIFTKGGAPFVIEAAAEGVAA